jgi:hypothetical protein
MRFNMAIALVCLSPVLLQADQARKFDRQAPLKEPAYGSQPRYALLAFGLTGKDRVWVVVDGGVCYVDRNANGDLTEEGEKVVLPSREDAGVPQYRQWRTANLGEIRTGRNKHTIFQFTQSWVNKDFKPTTPNEKALVTTARDDPDGWIGWLTLDVQVQIQTRDGPLISGRITQNAGNDNNGYLRFSSRPQTAPVIHLGGPMTVDLLCPQELHKGEKPSDLMVMVGTPGDGPGTFASINYGGVVSDTAQPSAEIEFPAAPGAKAIVRTIALPHRC